MFINSHTSYMYIYMHTVKQILMVKGATARHYYIRGSWCHCLNETEYVYLSNLNLSIRWISAFMLTSVIITVTCFCLIPFTTALFRSLGTSLIRHPAVLIMTCIFKGLQEECSRSKVLT